ncbi:hypothetical protein F5Y18DRAFT_360955 [Xylariaceae sp. FL1019]|nr:hypothetical protein F5Y18DRAFT_360955 [Xylariaceae sp. FL1019]
MATKTAQNAELLAGTSFKRVCEFKACYYDRGSNDQKSTSEYTVYSTEKLESCNPRSTYLHLHDAQGSCLPTSFRTGQMIIQHKVNSRKQYFYVTARVLNLKTDKGAEREGNCVAVGVIPSYERMVLKDDEPQQLVRDHGYGESWSRRLDEDREDGIPPVMDDIELIHIHQPADMSVEQFDDLMSKKHPFHWSKLEEVFRPDRGADVRSFLAGRVSHFTSHELQLVRHSTTKGIFKARTGLSGQDTTVLYLPSHNEEKDKSGLDQRDVGCLVRDFAETAKTNSSSRDLMLVSTIGLLTGLGKEKDKNGKEQERGTVQLMTRIVSEVHLRFEYITGNKYWR